MIVLIDNYDSFSYNLYQLLGALADDVRVFRNDALTAAELTALSPAAVVLSPGPGRPAEAGICEAVVRELSGKVPILGVCLGHQAICEAFGGVVGHAPRVMHGKASTVRLSAECPLFAGLPPLVWRWDATTRSWPRRPRCPRACRWWRMTARARSWPCDT